MSKDSFEVEFVDVLEGFDAKSSAISFFNCIVFLNYSKTENFFKV